MRSVPVTSRLPLPLPLLLSPGLRAAPDLSAGDPMTGRVNYFLGNDPAKWRTNVATYRTLTYGGLYPGVDLAYGGQGRRLKGTYTVAPGADPTQIRWRYEGAT